MESNCVICGTATIPRRRSVLNSAANSYLIPLVVLLIQRVLVAEGKSCTDETATCISQVLNGDHDKNSFTYICSKCHTKLAHYYDTDYSLMAKLKKSFILNRFTSHDDETSEEEVTTSHDIHLCVPAQTIGEK